MNERMCKKKQLKHKIFSVENDSGSYLNLRANTNTSHITVHTREELKTNQFHVFSSLFAHSFRSFTYYYTDANFFFHSLFVRSFDNTEHLAMWHGSNNGRKTTQNHVFMKCIYE